MESCGSFISYRTGHYKLHYYETPTNLKFVMVTDTKTNNLRIVLHQIYVGLYVEYGMFYSHLLRYWVGFEGFELQEAKVTCADIRDGSGQKPAVTRRTPRRCRSQLRNVRIGIGAVYCENYLPALINEC